MVTGFGVDMPFGESRGFVTKRRSRDFPFPRSPVRSKRSGMLLFQIYPPHGATKRPPKYGMHTPAAFLNSHMQLTMEAITFKFRKCRLSLLRKSLFSPFFQKKILQNLLTLLFENSPIYLTTKGHSRIFRNIVERSRPSCTRIRGPVKDTSNPALQESATTHNTRLQGYVKLGSVKTPGPLFFRRFSKNLKFRMSQRIFSPNPNIAFRGKNMSVPNEEGPYGDISSSSRFVRLLKGQTHICFGMFRPYQAILSQELLI